MAGNFVSRSAATRIGVGNSGAARINGAEMLVDFPFLLQHALEGRVWMAGHGLEETATDGEAALDETTPTFMLMAPASGTIVVPIWAEMRMHAEGGAAPDMYLSYVGVDRTGATKTDLDKIPVGRLSADAVTSAAIAAKTISAVTAITSAQTVLLARRADVLDNLISVEAATTRAQIETPHFPTLALEFDFWAKFHGAFALYQGQSIMFHTATGTTDSTYSVSFLWLELPTNPFIP